MSLEVKRGSRPPIHHYREQTLETSIACVECGLQYSIYGLFAFCPDCRSHNSLQILEKNLDLTLKEIELAEIQENEELSRHLLEDALENCVSAFDGFGRQSCAVRAPHALDTSKSTSFSFQNLNKANENLENAFGVVLRSAVPHEGWATVNRGFSKRHLIAHQSGIVDQQYLAETKDTSAVLGRRIPLEPSEVRETVEIVRRLGETLISSLPGA